MAASARRVGRCPNLAEAEDAEDSGQKAFNYRTEPLWKRMSFDPDEPLMGERRDGRALRPRTATRDFDFTNVLSNSQVGGVDPVTPVFTAQRRAGRALPHAAARRPRAQQRVTCSTATSGRRSLTPTTRPSSARNPLSEWKGSQYGIGPGSHFDFLLKNGAGGKFAVPGDYLYRTGLVFPFDGGIWGIFRVNPEFSAPPTCTCPKGMMCTDIMCAQQIEQ